MVFVSGYDEVVDLPPAWIVEELRSNTEDFMFVGQDDLLSESLDPEVKKEGLVSGAEEYGVGWLGPNLPDLDDNLKDLCRSAGVEVVESDYDSGKGVIENYVDGCDLAGIVAAQIINAESVLDWDLVSMGENPEGKFFSPDEGGELVEEGIIYQVRPGEYLNSSSLTLNDWDNVKDFYMPEVLVYGVQEPGRLEIMQLPGKEILNKEIEYSTVVSNWSFEE